eukprot:1260504-Pyramimonas_sp.AAC.1
MTVLTDGRLRCGDVADSADAVFRINYPPTAGFQQDVGGRTNFDLVNHHNLQVRTHGTVPSVA